VRDEPGIGTFVVILTTERAAAGQAYMLARADIAALRASKEIIAERTRAIFHLRPSMPPPVHRHAPEL
jgi:hypothetical protein